MPWQVSVDEGMKVDTWIDVAMLRKDRAAMFMFAMVDLAQWPWAETSGP